MRPPLILGVLLLLKLSFLLVHTKKLDQRHISPFHKELYPQEYKIEFPIPLVITADQSSQVTASGSSSVETGSLEEVTTSLVKRRLLVSGSKKSKIATAKSGKDDRGRSPNLGLYWKRSRAKPKKKIRKPGPKLTTFWKPPKQYKKHQGHGPSPQHHGPPQHFHGPPPQHHGPPHHHGPHFYGPPPPHYHHHHRVPAKKTPAVVAFWKDNQKYANQWRPKDHKKFKRVHTRMELVPEYLSDLALRLKNGLGILPPPSKHNNGHGQHGWGGKQPISYHSGFYTEVQ